MFEEKQQIKYNTITIKVGSNVLTRSNGQLNIERMTHLVDQIAEIHKQGLKVILVSSGAIASGRSLLNRSPSKKDPVSERQLLSSVGQAKLVTTYSNLFDSDGISCAQVLVTKEDFRTREHYLNMKNCLTVLLNNNIVPIINENDAVSVTALMFTDNDELAALVASMMNSDAMFVLSDVDGIFKGHPDNENAELIEKIDSTQTDLSSYIVGQKSNFGRGGMLTKGKIAQNTAASGIDVHIANGKKDNIILDLIQNNVKHTHFIAGAPSPAIKKWMASSAGFANSQVYIEEGAKAALFAPKATSLLLAGVYKMSGDFKKGDLLKIIDEENRLIGIGKAQYERKKAEKHFNDKKYKPLIHYDYLFLFPCAKTESEKMTDLQEIKNSN